MKYQELRQNQIDETSLIDITEIIDDIYKEFKRLWWLILVFISICSSVFYFQRKLIYVPYYEASATYTVSVKTTTWDGDDYYNETAAKGLGTSLQYLMQSKVMKSVIAEELGLDTVPGTISVSTMENTNLMTFTARAKNPELAYMILQAALNNYPSVAEYVIGSTTLEIMDETGIPAGPVNGENAKQFAISGVMVGVLLGFILLLGISITKKTIKKEEDFQNYFNMECYGAVPAARFKRRGRKTGPEANTVLIDNFRIPGGFVESLRGVRTKFEQDAKKKSVKVVLVTSSIAGEGKSTVSSNLGLSLAKKRKKVVIIDLDLRAPALANHLNIHDYDYGTIDILEGRCSLDDCMLQYKNSNLYIVPGGNLIHETTTLLTSQKCKDLVNELRERFDYVIIDTPPCAILSDAAIIGTYSDSALFVVRQDYARVQDITEGIRNLSEDGVSICGCVLNYAEVGITGYGYGQGYGYGRYGYGYGNRKNGYGYGSYGYGVELAKSAAESEDDDQPISYGKSKVDINDLL